MKIAVITDLHANLPALQAALGAIEAEGCDRIYHTGDAVAVGPHPRECVELLLSLPKMQALKGNHENYFVYGIPDPRPAWMSDGEVAHQRWVREQLGPELREEVAAWPYKVRCDFEGVRTTFIHYALDRSGRDFEPIVREPAASDLEGLFGSYGSQLLFYGHDHRFADRQGRTRTINPGSLGCQSRSVAPYTVAEFKKGRFSIEHRAVPYDDKTLFQDFEERQVPERYFLYPAFFGGRYAKESQ